MKTDLKTRFNAWLVEHEHTPEKMSKYKKDILWGTFVREKLGQELIKHHPKLSAVYFRAGEIVYEENRAKMIEEHNSESREEGKYGLEQVFVFGTPSGPCTAIVHCFWKDKRSNLRSVTLNAPVSYPTIPEDLNIFSGRWILLAHGPSPDMIESVACERIDRIDNNRFYTTWERDKTKKNHIVVRFPEGSIDWAEKQDDVKPLFTEFKMDKETVLDRIYKEVCYIGGK